jgi:hypothetical protein
MGISCTMARSWMCKRLPSPLRLGADGRVVHTCRDFEAIRNWAFERTAGVVDFEIWVPDPLKGEV